MVARSPASPLRRSPSRHTSSPSSSSVPAPPRLKGVRKRSWGKWVSEIRLPHTRARLWLGSYATAEQAARAFDVALVCLRGRSAALNFPDSPPAFAPLGLPHHQIQALAAAAAVDYTSTPILAPPADQPSYRGPPASSPNAVAADGVCSDAGVSTNAAHDSGDLTQLCDPLRDDESSPAVLEDASVKRELQQMGDGELWNELPPALWVHDCGLDPAFVPLQLPAISDNDDEYGDTGATADPHDLWSL